MDLDELKEALHTYFSDTSRTARETRDGLYEIADECNGLADTLDVGPVGAETDTD